MYSADICATQSRISCIPASARTLLQYWSTFPRSSYSQIPNPFPPSTVLEERGGASVLSDLRFKSGHRLGERYPRENIRVLRTRRGLESFWSVAEYPPLYLKASLRDTSTLRLDRPLPKTTIDLYQAHGRYHLDFRTSSLLKTLCQTLLSQHEKYSAVTAGRGRSSDRVYHITSVSLTSAHHQ